VPHTDPLFNEYRTLEDVPPHFLREVAHFFTVYKELEHAEVKGGGWDGLESAYTEIRRAAQRYQERYVEE
jgi:inorganic pyrophosphatase